MKENAGLSPMAAFSVLDDMMLTVRRRLTCEDMKDVSSMDVLGAKGEAFIVEWTHQRRTHRDKTH
jgi:hypothetical protein